MEELIQQLEEIQNGFIKMARDNTGPEPNAICVGAFQISETCRIAAEVLRRNIPQEMEMEGGGSSWWYVCPECHGAIDRGDRFCRHCGQAVKA
jgi:hypothetical protein